ncbi:hypothetical protein N9O57_02275 [bacterium]|nr:hypothetical protein [bacterium]
MKFSFLTIASIFFLLSHQDLLAKTADDLAGLTGCQVVVPTGRVSTFSKIYSNHWFSDRALASLDWEKEVFYRATPVKKYETNFWGKEQMKVSKIVKENLGVRYIAY